MCVCMSYGEADGGRGEVTAVSPRNIRQAHSSGPFCVGTWAISTRGMDLRSVYVDCFINGETGTSRKSQGPII